MFNLFGKNEEAAPETIFTDRTYISTAAKTNACIALAKATPDALFICWFTETLKNFRAAFAVNGLDELKVVDTKNFHSALLQNKIPVFTEHFPLHAKEIDLVSHWHLKNIVVYSAMDEPLFKHFGSEKMIPLMKLLGMKENEVIEHSFVSQSIIKGQNKIAAMVSFEQPANSQKEWLEKNLK